MMVCLLIQKRLVQEEAFLRPEKPSNQYFPTVRIFGQSPDNEARFWPLEIPLPESCRCLFPDHPVIAILKGYDSKSGCVENASLEFAGAAPYQDIAFERPDLFDILVGESIHETGCRHCGIYFQYCRDYFAQVKLVIMVPVQTNTPKAGRFHRRHESERDS